MFSNDFQSIVMTKPEVPMLFGLPTVISIQYRRWEDTRRYRCGYHVVAHIWHENYGFNSGMYIDWKDVREHFQNWWERLSAERTFIQLFETGFAQ